LNHITFRTRFCLDFLFNGSYLLKYGNLRSWFLLWRTVMYTCLLLIWLIVWESNKIGLTGDSIWNFVFLFLFYYLYIIFKLFYSIWGQLTTTGQGCWPSCFSQIERNILCLLFNWNNPSFSFSYIVSSSCLLTEREACCLFKIAL